MVLIADSGASKIEWKLIYSDRRIETVNTLGFNPYNQPISELKKTIQKNIHPQLIEDVTQIFFYSAGTTTTEKQQTIETTLQTLFVHSAVEVHSDLLGAARALCDKSPAIACILGTGSNCGLYDGNVIHRKTPSLGWILNDEGSGSDLGKHLLMDYLYKKMPNAIASSFHQRYPWNEDTFLQHLYRGKMPAKFLGAFSHFIADHIQNPYCRQLVCSRFEAFCKKQITAHENYTTLKVHFAGSIAFHYSNLLKHVGNTMGIAIGNIIKSPIEKLAAYHQKHALRT